MQHVIPAAECSCNHALACGLSLGQVLFAQGDDEHGGQGLTVAPILPMQGDSRREADRRPASVNL